MLNIGCYLTVSKGYEDIKGLEGIMAENYFTPIQAHAHYTLNMAAAKEETFDFIKRAFWEDLERLEKPPCSIYNFHPGSPTEKGKELSD